MSQGNTTQGRSYLAAGVAIAGILIAIFFGMRGENRVPLVLGWAVAAAALLWLIQSVEVLVSVLVLGQFLTHYLVQLLGGEASRNAVFEPALLMVFGTIGLGYFVRAYLNGSSLSPSERQAAALVFAVGVLLAAGSTYAPMRAEGLTKTVKYFALDAFPVFIILLGVQSMQSMRRLVLVLVVVGTVKCLLTLGGASTAGELAEQGVRSGEGQQFMGFYLNSGIWFGRQVTCAIISAIIASYLLRGIIQKVALWVVVLFLVFVLLLAGSKGPLVGLIGSVAVLYAFLKRRAFTTILAIILLLATVYGALEMMPSSVRDRFTKNDLTNPEGSTQIRIRLYTLGKNLFLDHLFFGTGTTGFNYYNMPYEEGTYSSWNYVHNIFLEFAADHGIIGVGLICALLWVFWTACWSSYRDAPFGTERFYLATWVVAMYFAAFINAQFSGDVTTNEGIWIAGALGVRLRALMEKEPRTARIPKGSAEPAPVGPENRGFGRSRGRRALGTRRRNVPGRQGFSRPSPPSRVEP
jgi:O-antigen ligase